MDARPSDERLRSRSLILVAFALSTAGASCAGGSAGTTGSGGSTSTGTGGSMSTGGSKGTGGSNSGAGGTNSGAGGTGGVTGAAGATGSGGLASGTGGANSSGGATGSAGATGSGGSTGSAGASGAAGNGGCPSGYTFCSGFESPGLPVGATYLYNASPGDWSRDFAIDSSQHHSGNSSLLVRNSTAAGSSNSALRLLGVPVPTGAFWVRFWVQSDTQMGGTNQHNAFAGPSNFDTANTSGIIDAFCEDRGIAFNTMDPDVTWPTGYGQLQSGTINPYTIPAMTWTCIELSYDLANRHQQLYIGGTLLIDAANYPPASSYSSTTFSAFTFGFDAFHGPPRQIWYDDVVVAPARIGGCN
jgi:hypothetical protein